MIPAPANSVPAPRPQPLSALEKGFVLYTSFGLIQFFNTFISFDVGKYIFSAYAQLFVLTTWWCLIVLQKQTFRRVAVPAIVVLAAILSIEGYHVWRVGIGRGDVTGIKAILYNPLYAPLMDLVVFVLVLHEYGAGRRLEVIKFVLATAVRLTVLGMIMWALVYTGVVRFSEAQTAEAVQVLNNNVGAYVSCFVLYCLWFTEFRRHITSREHVLYTAVALSSIFLYTSRGTILVIGMYGAVLLFRRVSLARLIVASVALMAVAVVAALLTRSSTAQQYYDVFAVLAAQARDLRQYVGPLVQFEPMALGDLTRGHPSDSMISAVGRVFASVLALDAFRTNPLLGVGTYTAYNIDAYGAGVHSLPFLYAASSGVLGIVLLAVLFGMIRNGRRVSRHHLLYLLPVGMFTNIFPLWYACSFFLDYDAGGALTRRRSSAAPPASGPAAEARMSAVEHG